MRFAWIFIVILAVYWCTENSTNIVFEDQSRVSVFEQIPGCLEWKLTKTEIRDSVCFHYDFHQNLKLELCLPANCCPDSNRFDYSYEVHNDTIHFTALDTAQDLCDCICTYQIQTEISGLLKDTYIFQCLYEDKTVYDTLVYR